MAHMFSLTEGELNLEIAQNQGKLTLSLIKIAFLIVAIFTRLSLICDTSSKNKTNGQFEIVYKSWINLWYHKFKSPLMSIPN